MGRRKKAILYAVPANEEFPGSLWNIKDLSKRPGFAEPAARFDLDAPSEHTHCGKRAMKVTDDYKAKLRICAAEQRVVPLPAGPPIPKFRSKKFRNHAEMNEWKRELLRQMARENKSDG